MSGQHRTRRKPSLLERIGDRLSRVGDRRIRAIAGDITDPWGQPYPTGMTDQYDDPEPGPIVLDHPHRLNDHGVCDDIRCDYDPARDPATQTVVPVPPGEPEFRTWHGFEVKR